MATPLRPCNSVDALYNTLYSDHSEASYKRQERAAALLALNELEEDYIQAEVARMTMEMNRPPPPPVDYSSHNLVHLKPGFDETYHQWAAHPRVLRSEQYRVRLMDDEQYNAHINAPHNRVIARSYEFNATLADSAPALASPFDESDYTRIYEAAGPPSLPPLVIDTPDLPRRPSTPHSLYHVDSPKPAYHLFSAEPPSSPLPQRENVRQAVSSSSRKVKTSESSRKKKPTTAAPKKQASAKAATISPRKKAVATSSTKEQAKKFEPVNSSTDFQRAFGLNLRPRTGRRS
ncbi:hypothetical protein VKT23_018388 [Stygiomarasmius scandens]|uniref:Uncharacterized protein n=1 Tax=Marasmiellus scandens TaxID=2682957 RepID=A0ABR1IR76_9AGAR